MNLLLLFIQFCNFRTIRMFSDHAGIKYWIVRKASERVERTKIRVFWSLVKEHQKVLRIKKTRILVRSTRSEAFRTIQYLIPAGSENVRMVRKLQNFMKNQKLKELRCTQNQIDAMMKSTSLIKTQINKKNHQGELLKVIRFWWGILKLGCTGRKKSF